MAIGQRRSQATIFLISGVIIFLTIFIIIASSKSSTETTLRAEIIYAQNAAFDTQPIRNFVHECLSMVSKDSLTKDFGGNATKLQNFVKNNIDLCLDFSMFEEQGFDILKEESAVNVSINENNVGFEMKYPITIIGPIGEKTEIRDFFVRHKLIDKNGI